MSGILSSLNILLKTQLGHYLYHATLILITQGSKPIQRESNKFYCLLFYQNHLL